MGEVLISGRGGIWGGVWILPPPPGGGGGHSENILVGCAAAHKIEGSYARVQPQKGGLMHRHE